jgi:hypothetical protein
MKLKFALFLALFAGANIVFSQSKEEKWDVNNPPGGGVEAFAVRNVVLCLF